MPKKKKSVVPHNLPQCKLLELLANKVEARHDVDFGFWGKLSEFRDRVSQEVRQINELFPEYTPHDEHYHLKRLFPVADTVLGENLLQNMNSAELFVLAASLYGHDWGMAVSSAEKEYILTGKPPDGTPAADLWLLPDERQRIKTFLDKRRLLEEDGAVPKELPIEAWREYVREMHALRSGERVRRFFEKIDGGVAEAASRVCAGHGMSFEDLEDYKSYPPDFSVLREPVNLRALAVYLRLVDLFDLAEDRTPYVIWKFVAPRDTHSKMEWAKHRALRPVTCPTYQSGRIVQVDGSTNDNEVYAALEDLRIYCEGQLRGCNDLLARMNDPRHKLDLYHVEWRVAARGFNPISIRFEFDRERMFEVLSDEIYQGDPYVFLRELLQNSIDAIRMRREVLQRNGVSPSDNLGVIQVDVQHSDGGSAAVTWHDDGIGMDEYVVRNYLAVAGKSYYQSEDFERQGLKMDPISRFGVGLLSCFMVADRIEIDTFKEPYLPPHAERLSIKIPSVRSQFRIQVLPQEGVRPGTTVLVHVEGRKLPRKDGEKVKPLDVTGYLSVVAGFVEFPIVINEGERKTIILHPYQDAGAARRRFGESYVVQQLDLNYPWSEAIMPQDLATAREVLHEVRWEIKDLVEGYQGTITYPIPNDPFYCDGGYSQWLFSPRGKLDQSTRQVRFTDNWEYEHEGGPVYSRSSSHLTGENVYVDGILVPESHFHPYPDHRDRTFAIYVNLPKSGSTRLDLARTHLRDERSRWDAQIFDAHMHHLVESSLNAWLKLDPAERFYQLERVTLFHGISAEDLWNVFPRDRWPLPFLEAGGQVNVLELKDIANDSLLVLPSFFDHLLKDLLLQHLVARQEYSSMFLKWHGGRIFFNTSDLNQVVLKNSYHLTAVQFLAAPWQGQPPLLQYVYDPLPQTTTYPSIELVLEKAARDPSSLDPIELTVLNKQLPGIPTAVRFFEPFSRCYGYGREVLNLKHSAVGALLRLVAAFTLSRRRQALPPATIGYFDDCLHSILFGSHEQETLQWNWWSGRMRELWSVAQEARLPYDIAPADALIVPATEFVPGTASMDEPSHFWGYESSVLGKAGRTFGQPLA